MTARDRTPAAALLPAGLSPSAPVGPCFIALYALSYAGGALLFLAPLLVTRRLVPGAGVPQRPARRPDRDPARSCSDRSARRRLRHSRDFLPAASVAGTYLVQLFDGHPVILVGLEAVDIDEASELIIDSWRCRAPKSLVKQLGPEV